MRKACLLVACAVVGAVQAAAPLAKVRDQKYLTDERFTAIAADDTDLFVGSPNKVLKISQKGLSKKTSLDISGRGYSEVAALVSTDDFIYVAASGKVVGKRTNAILKINKAMQVVKELHFPESLPIAYSLVADDKHLYTGHYSFPGKLCRIPKDLSSVDKCISMNKGENDIRQLETDPHDPLDQYIYANTNTKPGMIVKIRKSTMTRVAAVKLSIHEDYALSGIELGPQYLFVGTNTAPGYIVKIDKVLMREVGKLKLPKGQDRVASLEADAKYIFATTFDTPSYVIRVRKADLTIESSMKFGEQGEDRVSTLVGTKNGLFVATYTAPADIVQLTGYTAPSPCQYTMWSDWEHPRGLCGGKRRKFRKLLNPKNVGCSGAVEKWEDFFASFCKTVDKCSSGGLMFSNSAPTEQCRPTCWNPAPQCKSVKPGCVCPADKPFLDHHLKCVAKTGCPEEHMRTCSHVSCRWDGHHVRVIHHQHEHHGNHHVCRHSADMLGGCHCMCFQVAQQ